MPLLTALDEYDSAITNIAIHANLALANTEPAQQEAALRLILSLYHRTDEIVEDVLSYAHTHPVGTMVLYDAVSSG